MKMTEIRKESIGMGGQISDGIASLAESAKSVLGYDVLAKVTGKVAQDELSDIQKALQVCEIEILNPRDVTTYQKERLIERSVELLKSWVSNIGQKDSIHSYDHFYGPSWTLQKISEYKKPVPEFVLAKAVQVKQAIPECDIWIESLEDHLDPFLVVSSVVDKYMEPEEPYYIEVWAEPEFEVRLNAAVEF